MVADWLSNGLSIHLKRVRFPSTAPKLESYMNRRKFFGALAVLPAAPVVALMPSQPMVVNLVSPTAAEIADAVWNSACTGSISTKIDHFV